MKKKKVGTIFKKTNEKIFKNVFKTENKSTENQKLQNGKLKKSEKR